MVGKLLLPEIKSLIDTRDFGALRELFREWPRADVAEVILDMPENDQVIIFRVLPAALIVCYHATTRTPRTRTIWEDMELV